MWLARELMPLLGYKKWDNFQGVIHKAKTSADKFGLPVENHFADVGKMVSVGYGNNREILDVVLTRHACYLIAINGNSKKLPIAAAQNYFAIKARERELEEERIWKMERVEARKKLAATEKEFADTLRRHDVDNPGIAAIRSGGDQVDTTSYYAKTASRGRFFAACHGCNITLKV